MTTSNPFSVGQIVRVKDPRSLAYGRIAMVMRAGDRLSVRFADLPRNVNASDPTGFVSEFCSDQLEPTKEIPIAPHYSLIDMTVTDGGRESCEFFLAHANSAEELTAIYDNLVQTWYDADAKWDDNMDGYWVDGALFVEQGSMKPISMAEYFYLSEFFSDCTPRPENP